MTDSASWVATLLSNQNSQRAPNNEEKKTPDNLETHTQNVCVSKLFEGHRVTRPGQVTHLGDRDAESALDFELTQAASIRLLDELMETIGEKTERQERPTLLHRMVQGKDGH